MTWSALRRWNPRRALVLVWTMVLSLGCGGVVGPPDDPPAADVATPPDARPPDLGDPVRDAGVGPDVGAPDAGSEARDDAGPDAVAPARGVELRGDRLVVDGQPFFIRGVCWNPVPKGGGNGDRDFRGFVEQDGDMMAAAGINAVRTYGTITDRTVLDALYARGIYVLNSIYIWGGAPVHEVDARVRSVMDHPAILMWVVGNEWNYNGLYAGLSFEDARARVAEVVARVKSIDTSRPVATVYGELPDRDTLRILDDVDVWGINAYRGISFYDLFDAWEARSDRPMFMAEYGADAFDARIGRPNLEAQAEATRQLTREIVDRSPLGGTIFSWSDEWWKDRDGRPDEHDTGGFAPGGGPHPDQTFNEEWWGLVDVDRRPRPALRELTEAFAD